MIILNNVVRSEFDMRQYLSDIRDMKLQSGQTLRIYGVLPTRASRKDSVVSRNQNFHQVVQIVDTGDERQVAFGSVTKNLRGQTYKWDPTDAEPLIASMFVDTDQDFDNMSGPDAMRLFNRMYSIIKEHCLHTGQFTGLIYDTVLKPDFLKSLGITENTPRGQAVITLESNLNTLGVPDAILLEFTNPSNTNEVLAKWLVQYSLGRRFNDIFKNFADQVIPRRATGQATGVNPNARPERLPPGAFRQLPMAYQQAARRGGWQ